MRILYIVIGDLASVASGSGLRPNAILRAFLDRGHDVFVISGHEGRREGKDRLAEVKKAKQWVAAESPDLCYIESSTYPMIHRCDYEMIRWLKKNNIPIAYFYRDLDRKCRNRLLPPKGIKNKIKDIYLRIMQWRTDKVLHRVDIVYFPSERCFNYFQYKNMKSLPPAGEENFLPIHKNTKTCIYVGGVSAFYGYDLIMDAFEKLNEEDDLYKLILVCRNEEYQRVNRYETDPHWLEVHHVSGDDLIPLYGRSDLGLIALQSTPYADLAICIKLYQYAGFGLPVLSTDVSSMSAIIKEEGFGEVCGFTEESFSAAIRYMLDDDRISTYRKEIEESITNRNLWIHRVDQIIEDLIGQI